MTTAPPTGDLAGKASASGRARATTRARPDATGTGC